MTFYMLDTNVASAALRGTAGLDERLQRLDPEQWCISAITRAEMRYGVALKPGATKLAQIVEAFLQATTTMPWDEAAADAHGRLRARLRSAGTPIGDFDEMIAAHALAVEAVLVTDNTRHFERVDGLVLENWVRDDEIRRQR
jgi:tRNA(fMet)-specific endonuclease VapC